MPAFSNAMLTDIRTWITAGCAAVKTHYVFRYQDTYPNTYCYVWVGPTIGGVVRPWACQDVHYTGAGAFQALGGFWIRGINASMQSQQELHARPWRVPQYNILRALVPVPPPAKHTVMNYQTVMEYLRGY